MRPITVRLPVRQTTPVPRPLVIVLPACSSVLRSPSGVCGSISTSARFVTGTDSPVSSDSSARRSCARSRRMSAGTDEPDRTETMSPGASSLLSTCARLPPRVTFAVIFITRSSASAALSALYS